MFEKLVITYVKNYLSNTKETINTILLKDFYFFSGLSSVDFCLDGRGGHIVMV